jgi:hypothetical protein
MNQMLAGRTVLITQAAQFMGPALCEMFAEQGAVVIASEEPLAEPGAAQRVVHDAGRFDVLVANLAYTAPSTPAVDVDDDEWREVFAALFEQDAGAMIDIDVASIRSLRDDVAVVDGVSRIAFTDSPPSSSRFSAVLVREDGNWVLDTVRESNRMPQHADSEPARRPPAQPLDELAWLVGSWEDVSEGVTASTHCFWSTNKAFLIRTHMISSDAVQEQRPLPGDSRIPGLLSARPAGSREITEIVGWDPDRGQIRSWLFTSAGRFAEGSWSREGDVWTLRLEDAGGDCLCTLTRVGPDEMTCSCDTDRLADIAPPACDSVRTAAAAADAPR